MESGTAYGALSLLPAIVAIALAIWKRQVIVSLLFGIFIGATIINSYNPVKGLIETFSTFIVKKSLSDSWNMGIIVFCLAIGGMIGVISKMGGTKAIADALVRKAKGTKSTMLTTAFMGLAIFFDDYANSMIVGNAMRPVTDGCRISREKLAYLLDSTAAPVCAIAPLSTWIAMELGLIASGLKGLKIEENSMMVFFQTIPYSFYSLFAIVMVFALVFMSRDFGTMLKAEIRARKTGQVYASDSEPMIAEDKDLYPDEGVSLSAWDAFIPILAFVVITIIGLWYSGGGMEAGKSIKDAYGDADASVVLTWGAFIGSIIAIAMGLIKGKFNLSKAVEAWVGGAKTMLVAVIILGLAFSLKAVITDMKLAEWLVAATKGSLSGGILPTLTFVIAVIIAFSTGTSWGTNAILMPIIIPVAASVSGVTDATTPLMYASIAAVMTGAVFGDHCSPISDTTILSSMAAGSDHVDHVRTQVPYAVTGAVISIIFGFIPAGFGVPVWISLILGIAAIIAVAKFVGKEINDKGEIVG